MTDQETAVPAAAIEAAQQADREFGRKNGGVWLAVGHLRLASILEAAAPHLAQAADAPAVTPPAGPPPAFAFESAPWSPPRSAPVIHGHPLAGVTHFDVHADPCGFPAVTIGLAAAEGMRLALGDGAGIELDPETREALISLGWTPPAGTEDGSGGG